MRSPRVRTARWLCPSARVARRLPPLQRTWQHTAQRTHPHAQHPPPLPPHPHPHPHHTPPCRYEFNGGTILAVAGDDYVVLGADTRLSSGYSILSRRVSKVCALSSTCVMGSGGCYTDIQTLHKNLQIKSAMYKHDHACEMGSAQVAQLLSTTLYGRRFFPYYAFNIVAGTFFLSFSFEYDWIIHCLMLLFWRHFSHSIA